jgi:hypothetical protein
MLRRIEGIFCALYGDRGSHFWPKAGEHVDPNRLTQGGAGVARVGNPDDPGLLAAGAGTQ